MNAITQVTLIICLTLLIMVAMANVKEILDRRAKKLFTPSHGCDRPLGKTITTTISQDGIVNVDGKNISFNFKKALELMKEGHKVKLPSWGGYWYWDKEKKTVVMVTKDNKSMDIRETQVVEYTLLNVCSSEWVLANGDNTPILGGINTFGYGEAIKYLKRGWKLARKGWNGKGIFIKLQVPDSSSKMTHPYIYIDTTGLDSNNENAPRSLVPWLASQTDMLADDWICIE